MRSQTAECGRAIVFKCASKGAIPHSPGLATRSCATPWVSDTEKERARIIRVSSIFSACYMLNTNFTNIPNVYDIACHVFV